MAACGNSLPEQKPAPTEKSQLPWMAIAWFGTLLITCYAPVLWGLAHQWASDEDVGHGFLVPVVAAYIVWKRRAPLMEARLAPSYWGLAVVAFGALALLLGTL